MKHVMKANIVAEGVLGGLVVNNRLGIGEVRGIFGKERGAKELYGTYSTMLQGECEFWTR
jgi:hypothetical protein